MSRWMQMVAVALAAVVGLVPTFAQLSYAQALPEPVSVLPLGEQIPDEELLEVEGEVADWLIFLAACLFVGALTGYMAHFYGGASPLDAAIWGVSAMLMMVVGAAAPVPR